MTDIITAEQARELLENLDALVAQIQAHPRLEGPHDKLEDARRALRLAAPDLARSVIALHAELARVTKERDAALALIAAAYLDAAERCALRDHAEGEEETEFDRGYDQACDECATIILSRTPADAQAALATLIAEAERRMVERAVGVVAAISAACRDMHARESAPPIGTWQHDRWLQAEATANDIKAEISALLPAKNGGEE